MTVNLFDPSQFGFADGSPIFGYPPNAKKLINEAIIRIRGSSNYVQFWDRVLDSNEREELGDDVDQCASVNPNIIDLLCKIRTCWCRERVVAEIAHKLGYLSPNDYDWVCQLTSEATPVSALIPTWNLETGRLEFDGKLCREIQVSIAKTIVPVLDQFQQQGWPQSVEYQFLTADPQEIYQIRKRLMADMNYIAFRVKAQKIFWEPTPA